MVPARLKVMEAQITLFDRTFRDSEGNVVIAQAPNLPLLVWLVATLLKFILTSGNLYTGLDAIAFGSLFTWRGRNSFRALTTSDARLVSSSCWARSPQNSNGRNVLNVYFKAIPACQPTQIILVDLPRLRQWCVLWQSR